MGALLVLFLYICALASKPKFNMSVWPLVVFTGFFFIRFLYKEFSNGFEFFVEAESLTSLGAYKLLQLNDGLLVLLGALLLMVLIIRAHVAGKPQGSLRAFKYESFKRSSNYFSGFTSS